jgi:hypothetical protein
MTSLMQPGPLKDAFAGLGDGADRSLLEGLANRLAISRHRALRAIRVPPECTTAAWHERDDGVGRVMHRLDVQPE